MRTITTLILFGIIHLGVFFSQGPYAPHADILGTTAIHKDSSILKAWGTTCTVTRGWLDIMNSSLGTVTVGTDSSAIGKAGVNGVVSLGDQGEAILTFAEPIANGPGPDFAVFENSFSNDFLELAFVEVSSDGINYYRFDAVSLTQDSIQVGAFGSIDATNIHNLAGKYRGQYGTPFDLQELSNIALLDIQNITHVKLIDVVGTINPQFASYDAQGNIINDPYPTDFGSGGFDLDAIGVIYTVSSIGIPETKMNWHIFPNPAQEKLFIAFTNNQPREITILDLEGKNMYNETAYQYKIMIDLSKLSPGIYLLKVAEENDTGFQKLIIQ